MIVYFTTFTLIATLLKLQKSKRLAVDIKVVIFYSITFILIIVMGLRYLVGTDYINYMSNYTLYLNKNFNWYSQPAMTLVAQMSSFFYNDYATWFFIMAIFTVLPIMLTIKKHSELIGMSVIMYVLLGCWHLSFNLVKQGAAASILFFGYRFLRDRDIVNWVLCCIVASTFHVTALLMIPIYFLVNSKLTRKKIALYIFFGVVISLSYDKLFYLVEFLKRGEHLVNMSSATALNSVNIFRIAVSVAPTMLYYLDCDKWNFHNNSDFNVLLNMSTLNAVLNISSMNSIYLNRFCVYTNIYNILFIPMLFKRLKHKWIIPLTIILYFIFWSYDLYKGTTTVVFRWIFER